jgi:hypothetical protein
MDTKSRHRKNKKANVANTTRIMEWVCSVFLFSRVSSCGRTNPRTQSVEGIFFWNTQ